MIKFELAVTRVSGESKEMIKNITVNRQTLMVRSLVCILCVLLAVVWTDWKIQPLAVYVESEIALAGKVVGCEKEFEAPFVAWPDPAEDGNCFSGYKFREMMDGERISKIGQKFKNQTYLDLLKVALFALLVSLLVQWLLALSVRLIKRVRKLI